ncbi:MAG: PPC domain-containing protein [Kofleriaceae bacterium]|nr:PPC domain-containing protein [Kofleriaceae bacterium]
MYRTALLPALLLSFGLASGACSDDEIIPQQGEFVKGGNGKADTSAEAVFLQFDFDGSLIADSSFGAKQKIEDQLLYTIGHLNGDRAVGRLDKLVLTDIEIESVDGRKVIRYHASLPVAWGNKERIPATYSLQLPLDTTFSALTKFTDDYGHDCVERNAHVDQGSMWYYYRPQRSNCSFADGDVITAEATVELSSINTTGKYPEYHKVWEDDVLKVVAIFGKYEDGKTSNSDAGISAYNGFARQMKNLLDDEADYTTIPASIPSRPGVAMPEVSFTADLGNGKSIEVVALLVDNIRTAPATFNTRYEELSGDADLISYNGHAGLGANIRAMARKGEWKTGQYAIVFMNGCDTYAYVDSSLGDAHSAVNSDDPDGTKYLDIVTNALPSFFRSMPVATTALIEGLLSTDDPMTYESIFRGIDSAEVVLVSGEQDNVYVPGFGETPVEVGVKEPGVAAVSSVIADEEHRFETPVLAAGNYTFTLTGDKDADLYIRVGDAPSTRNYDCRPYLNGSNEECSVEITTPASVHVMVRGWASNSNYELSSK